jgi:flotillin
MSSRLLFEQPTAPVGFLSKDQNTTVAGGVGIVVVSLVGLTLLSRWMIRICRPKRNVGCDGIALQPRQSRV